MSFAKYSDMIQAKSTQNVNTELIMQHKNMQTTKTYVFVCMHNPLLLQITLALPIYICRGYKFQT